MSNSGYARFDTRDTYYVALRLQRCAYVAVSCERDITVVSLAFVFILAFVLGLASCVSLAFTKFQKILYAIKKFYSLFSKITCRLLILSSRQAYLTMTFYCRYLSSYLFHFHLTNTVFEYQIIFKHLITFPCSNLLIDTIKLKYTSI